MARAACTRLRDRGRTLRAQNNIGHSPIRKEEARAITRECTLGPAHEVVIGDAEGDDDADSGEDDTGTV